MRSWTCRLTRKSRWWCSWMGWWTSRFTRKSTRWYFSERKSVFLTKIFKILNTTTTWTWTWTSPTTLTCMWRRTTTTMWTRRRRRTTTWTFYVFKRFIMTNFGENADKCRHCAKVFLCRRSLKIHMVTTHWRKAFFMRTMRQSVFYWTQLEDAHESLRWIKALWRNWRNCGKHFTKTTVLKIHKLFHSGEKPMWTMC